MGTIDEIIVLLRQVESQVKEEEEGARPTVREILRHSLVRSREVGSELLAPYRKPPGDRG
jgi:hypothetical protein